MKKLIALLMVAVLALCLCACSSSDTNKDVKVIDITLTEEEYAFGVKKGDAELLSKVNDYIAQIKQDGTFDEICDRYFGEGTPVGVTSAKQDSSKDQLIVATNAEFAPFEYMKGNTFYGVDMESVVFENLRFPIERTEKIESILALAEKINASLPEAIRNSWRWQILYLRARIDKEMLDGDMHITPACEALMEELCKIFHAETANYCVAPPTRDAMKELRGGTL
jgi:ABC-type amino acid transport substrate-binding protein